MTIQISRLALNEVIEALTQCAEYLEPMIDAEYFPDRAEPVPNKEMSLYALCEHTLEMLPSLNPAPKVHDKKGLDESLAKRVTNQEFADELNKHLPFKMFTGAK